MSGIWTEDNDSRFSFYQFSKIFAATCQIIHTATMMAGLYDSRTDVLILGESLYLIIGMLFTLTKAVALQFVVKDVKKITEIVDMLYQRQTKNFSEWKSVAQSYCLQNTILQIIYAVAVLLGGLSAILMTFLERDKSSWPLPFTAKYPYVQNGGLPYYSVYILQTVFIFHSLSIIIPIESIEIALMDQIAMNFDILASKLQQIGKNSDDKKRMRTELIELIREHQYLIWLSQYIGKVFNSLFLAKIIASSAFICFGVFVTSIALTSGNRVAIVKFTFYTLAATAQLFNHCFVGNKVCDKSVQIADAIYQTDWCNSSDEYRKDLQLVVLRAQKRIEFSAKPFHAFSRETFLSLISAAYSYFTVLRTVMNK